MTAKQEGEDYEGIADNKSIREEMCTLARAFCFIYPDDYSLALFFVKKKLLILLNILDLFWFTLIGRDINAPQQPSSSLQQ